MTLPLPQGQDRIPRITYRLHGLNKNILFVLSHLKEAPTSEGLEAFLPVVHTVTVLGGWWRWGDHHFLTVLELLNFSQQLFLVVCQGAILFPWSSRGRARDVIAPLGISLRITGRQRRFSLLVGFLGRVVMKPTPVLGTQGLIGPSEEATLFLGTIQKQAIGVLGRMALLQRGGFPAKTLQTSPHVQHFYMRLTIHGFHILQGLILSTKQQTRLHGTFHILPSLLRFSGLQTHVMARAYHIVHRLSFLVLRSVIHGRQCRCRLLHHVIQFFHHLFHGSSGIFHHLPYHRITVHGRHRLNGVLLLLVPRRVYAWLSLPFDRHRAQDFHPYHRGLFIPWTLGSHWSAYPTHIRTSHRPIGQLLPLQIRSSCLPIGQLSLFKELPCSLNRHSPKQCHPTST